MSTATIDELKKALDEMVEKLRVLEEGWIADNAKHRAESKALDAQLRAAHKLDVDARWAKQLELAERHHALLERIAVALETRVAEGGEGKP